MALQLAIPGVKRFYRGMRLFASLMATNNQRCLRSKKLRAVLYYGGEATCQRCGAELPDNWHADHITPYAISHSTNVHTMQALCPRCNLLKGDSMLRQHQRDMRLVCSEKKLGEHPHLREVICEVAPGGGKSLLPVIVAAELVPAIAERICWVVPRKTLQKQAEQSFLEPMGRRELNHTHEIRISANEINPSRGSSGYVTTYQAIGASPDLHRQEFARHRYILCLDEPHHIEEEAAWESAIAPLIESAALVVYMSGTMERGNGGRIAFLPYRSHQEGEVIDYEPTPDRAVIRYSYEAALREKAIIPAYFFHLDGRAEWIDKDGQAQSTNSLTTALNARDAIYTALQTEYSFQLLDRATQHWQEHKAHNPRSKYLVVAASQAKARDYKTHLQNQGIRAEIAVSDDTLAQTNIDRFKQHAAGGVDVLVTVQMAYEGLDVPAVTHIACLTHIRTRPWIEQMIARATRCDRSCELPWELQAAYIFTPDDSLMLDCIERIRNITEAVVQDIEQRETRGPRETERSERSFIAPMSSEVTRTRASELHGEDLDYDETEQIQKLMVKHHATGISPIQIKNIIADMGIVAMPSNDPVVRPDRAMMTLSQKESNIRKRIADFSRIVDRIYFECIWGQCNSATRSHFGVPRAEMSYDQLVTVWTWLQANFPDAVK